MIHTGVLDEPYPDEHFLGLLGRFARARQLISLRDLGWGPRSLFDRTANRFPNLPRLRRMLSGVSSARSGALAEVLLLRHSRLSLYALFLPATAARRMVSRFLRSWLPVTIHGQHHSLLDLSPEERIGYLRFCASCIQQDLETYRVTYWHVAHDLPGVRVCSIHVKPLRTLSGSPRRIALIGPGEADERIEHYAWGLTWESAQSEIETRYARLATALHALGGSGYIGHELAVEYGVLIEHLLAAERMPRRARPDRIGLALDILSYERTEEIRRTYGRHAAAAYRVLRHLRNEVAAGGPDFAVGIMAQSAYSPADQLSMGALGLINLERAAARAVQSRAMVVCGFRRCRRFTPDFVEQFERRRGVSRLETRGACVCGFTITAARGDRPTIDYGVLARDMLRELVQNGVRAEVDLAGALGIDVADIASMRANARHAATITRRHRAIPVEERIAKTFEFFGCEVPHYS